MSDEIKESKSVQPEVELNENAEHPPQIDSIPGGEKQFLPEEPEPPADSTRSMGCKSAKNVDVNDRKSNEKETRQTKITEFMPEKAPRSSSGSRPSSATKIKKDKSPSPPPDYDLDFVNDNDNQNNASSKARVGPVTRSSIALRRISIDFQDSDDEDNDVSRWAKRDVEEYRSGYPGLRQNSKQNTNLKFYTNKIESHPDGALIDDIHKKWKGDYRKLEYHHGFIQWLFPLQEAGLNWSADPLQKHEIEAIKKDLKAMERILKSYELMLDFYGFELKDRQTGEVIRTRRGDWRDRFDNLNTSSHNYLRITRILKCLGEFDYEHLKYPFLQAILREAITENQIPRCLRSCRDYWIETLKSKEERKEIRQFARKLIDCRNKNERPPDSVFEFRPSTVQPKPMSNSPIKHHRQSSDV